MSIHYKHETEFKHWKLLRVHTEQGTGQQVRYFGTFRTDGDQIQVLIRQGVKRYTHVAVHSKSKPGTLVIQNFLTFHMKIDEVKISDTTIGAVKVDHSADFCLRCSNFNAKGRNISVCPSCLTKEETVTTGAQPARQTNLRERAAKAIDNLRKVLGEDTLDPALERVVVRVEAWGSGTRPGDDVDRMEIETLEAATKSIENADRADLRAKVVQTLDRHLHIPGRWSDIAHRTRARLEHFLGGEDTKTVNADLVILEDQIDMVSEPEKLPGRPPADPIKAEDRTWNAITLLDLMSKEISHVPNLVKALVHATQKERDVLQALLERSKAFRQ